MNWASLFSNARLFVLILLPGCTNTSHLSLADCGPSALPLTMEKQQLMLTLTPVVASQLVQMFGPSDTGVKPLSFIN